MNDELIDYREASAILRLNPTTLRRYVSLGRLPYYKVGGRVFFGLAGDEDWLTNRHVLAMEK